MPTYEEAEKSWEGELINIYVSGTYSIEIHIGKENNETEKCIKIRCVRNNL